MISYGNYPDIAKTMNIKDKHRWPNRIENNTMVLNSFF